MTDWETQVFAFKFKGPGLNTLLARDFLPTSLPTWSAWISSAISKMDMATLLYRDTVVNGIRLFK